MKALLTLSYLLVASTALAQSAAVPGAPRATGGVYAHDGAVSPEATAVSHSSSYEHRAGYVGQLFDVRYLVLTTDPRLANEGSTVALGAVADADDDSFFEPSPDELTWTVVSGPVASITSNGVATTSSVYQNTDAIVRGTFLGVPDMQSFTVLNLNDDDFGSYAGDGLDDAWQVGYFGENNPLAAPTQDPDGDGQDNAFEFLTSTVPFIASSRFALRLEGVAGQPNHKRLVFGPIVPGRIYTAVTTDNLVSGPRAPFTSLTPTTPAAEGSLTDTAATGPRKFYRIEISKP